MKEFDETCFYFTKDHRAFLRKALKEQEKALSHLKPIVLDEKMKEWIKKSHHQDGCSYSRGNPMYKSCSCGKTKLEE